MTTLETGVVRCLMQCRVIVYSQAVVKVIHYLKESNQTLIPPER